MAKGPKITGDVRLRIAAVYLENPNWRAKEIQHEVNSQLRKENPRLETDWPGLSAVQKELTKIRKGHVKVKQRGLDEPFSLASLAKYNIPPEAVPVIMWVYRKRLREEEIHFTIRQALWIARLHTFFNPATDVEDWAFVYALREELCEILGAPFFTRDLDVEMMSRGKGLTALGRELYRYHPLPPPPPFPFDEREDWEQRLREKGYRVE